jgi:galactose mutarotase-like enzyme
VALIEQRNGHEIWTIASKDRTAQASFLPDRGGMGVSFKIIDQGASRELLYVQSALWELSSVDACGGWPFLFPICGRLKHDDQLEHYLHDGEVYRMPIHGFGPRASWTASSESDDELQLSLTDNDDTYACYPFRFRVALDYQVGSKQLSCRQEIENRGDHPMPYYAGFHPYFMTPPASGGKEDVQVDLEPVERLLYNEDLTQVIGHTDPTEFPASVTDPELNEQLHRVDPAQGARIIYPDGLTLHMEAKGVGKDGDQFPYVQLYTKENKPFFCVEPWMGVPNALNSGEGVRWLQPGQRGAAVITVRAERSRT